MDLIKEKRVELADYTQELIFFENTHLKNQPLAILINKKMEERKKNGSEGRREGRSWEGEKMKKIYSYWE